MATRAATALQIDFVPQCVPIKACVACLADIFMRPRNKPASTDSICKNYALWLITALHGWSMVLHAHSQPLAAQNHRGSAGHVLLVLLHPTASLSGWE